MYLFGRVESGRIQLHAHLVVQDEIAQHFPEQDRHRPDVVIPRLRARIEAGGWCTMAVVAVMLQDPNFTMSREEWEDELRAAGFERLPDQYITEIRELYEPIVGRDFHPDHANLWSYGTLVWQDYELHTPGGRWLVERKQSHRI